MPGSPKHRYVGEYPDGMCIRLVTQPDESGDCCGMFYGDAIHERLIPPEGFVTVRDRYGDTWRMPLCADPILQRINPRDGTINTEVPLSTVMTLFGPLFIEKEQ